MLKTGLLLRCDLADFDADDSYAMRIEALDDGLTYTWEGAGSSGTVQVPASVLQSGAQIVYFGQGTPSVDPSTALPPFLIARDALEALRDGEAISLTIGGVSDELEPAGTDDFTLTLNGEEQNVRALRARGD